MHSFQDCLYHHPVHKISFIAQDMTDNRAFGYIYGSPENGHRFFGIKTEKAAGQVVVAMRDLFQVVFELKKKEIDEAKQNIETGDSATVNIYSVFYIFHGYLVLRIEAVDPQQVLPRSQMGQFLQQTNPVLLMIFSGWRMRSVQSRLGSNKLTK